MPLSELNQTFEVCCHWTNPLAVYNGKRGVAVEISQDGKSVYLELPAQRIWITRKDLLLIRS